MRYISNAVNSHEETKVDAMTMTREQMDQLVDEHFNYEATDDVDGVMSTLSAGAEHEDV